VAYPGRTGLKNNICPRSAGG